MQAVREALVDLPDDVRADLLENLPGHLAEIAADNPGPLRDRLGPRADYAAELRAAAGWSLGPWRQRGTVRASAGRAVRRADASAPRSSASAWAAWWTTRAPATQARHLAPGWWVLRGWVAAQLLCRAPDGYRWSGIVRLAGPTRLAGAAISLAAIVISLWAGRRAHRASPWPRGLLVAASIGLCAWALTALIGYVGSANPGGVSVPNPVPATSATPGTPAPHATAGESSVLSSAVPTGADSGAPASPWVSPTP